MLSGIDPCSDLVTGRPFGPDVGDDDGRFTDEEEADDDEPRERHLQPPHVGVPDGVPVDRTAGRFRREAIVPAELSPVLPDGGRCPEGSGGPVALSHSNP
jgi:hypothetical protein